MAGSCGKSHAQPAALPEAMRKSGRLKIAGAMVWPPFNSIQSGQIVGEEVERAKLMATKLGLRPEVSDIKFATLTLSVRNGRYDVAIGQLGISPKRQKAVDFVPNFGTRFSLLVKPGGPGSTSTIFVDAGSRRPAVAPNCR
ncbi:transporter substrate-binding domain-containing protein [Sphingobium arseniciresistens]|uniref:transporter substrate-binding domain-containing protein n=1 Tax=Sphingobium arseniciresistens TaxID=3030834 RepID=UPI0030CA319F